MLEFKNLAKIKNYITNKTEALSCLHVQKKLQRFAQRKTKIILRMDLIYC